MKTIIEDGSTSNYLPSITIELSRWELAQLVKDNHLSQTKQIAAKVVFDAETTRNETVDYYQETKIVVDD